MATSEDQFKILQCSKCENDLKMDSKTLTCLHSLCGRCLDEEFKGETTGVGQCPECQELFKIDQLTLSPILVNSLKRRQRLESTEWKCDVCLEKGAESLAKIWCQYCDEFFCDKCEWVHKRFLKNHNSMELDGNGKEEVKKSMRSDLCNIHKKVEECYCDRCNVCLCDTCYNTHLNQSPDCPSRPISVREEAVKKRTSQGPTLLNEIDDLKNNLQKRNRKSRIYSEQLETNCHLKCNEIWQNYEDILKKLRDKMIDLCEEMRFLKDEQVKKWRESVEENERMLKKLDIWCLNLRYFLKNDEMEENEMIYGVGLVGSKLASSSAHLQEMKTKQLRKCELEVKFSNYWLQFIEGLKNEMIAVGSLNHSTNLIQFETEWNLPGSNADSSIQSILVSQNDNHIFLADSRNKSIMEFTESGELISECKLIHKGKEFSSWDMVFISSEMLMVNCEWERIKDGESFWEEPKLFFLERIKMSPFLKIMNIIDKKENSSPSFSVCQIKTNILICDDNKLKIDIYTEKGEYIKTIDTGESGGDQCPLIRSDPSTGNFWGLIPQSCKIFCFNENGQKLNTFETKERMSGFFINEFGNLYCCNEESLFSFLPEKLLHEFQKEFENLPDIFVSREKIFVCLKIDEQYLIKIFKILD